jgi:hypothetical protein
MDLFSLVDTDMLRKVIELLPAFSILSPAFSILSPTPSKQFLIAYLKMCMLLLITPCSQALPHCTKNCYAEDKISDLDSLALGCFRPISNLPFLRKILEEFVFKQLNYFKCQLYFLNIPIWFSCQPHHRDGLS